MESKSTIDSKSTDIPGLDSHNHKQDWACLSDLCDRALLLEKLGPAERRLEVCGVNFRLVGTPIEVPSLFGAISGALTGSAEDWDVFQQKTYAFMAEGHNWVDYYRRILDTFTSLKDGVQRNPGQILARIKNQSPGTVLELHAAARRFHFTFTVIFVEGRREEEVPECDVYTNHDPDVTGGAEGVKYTFVRWGGGKDSQNWHWELLKPIGTLMDIPDGCHPYDLKEAFIFPPSRQVTPRPTTEHRHALSLDTTLVFAEELSEFRYHPVVPRRADLYSVLSFVFFGTQGPAKLIKSEVAERRQQLAYVLNLSPHRKETLTGQGKLTHSTSRFATSAYLNGDPTDLRLAATMFRFSYRIFGINAGNATEEWKRFLVRGEHGVSRSRCLFFGSYTGKTMPNRMTQQEWFMLQEWRYEPIPEMASMYHCEPIRASLREMGRRTSGLVGKRSSEPVTLLLPNDFGTQEPKPVLHVESELGRQVQYEVFHKMGISGSVLTRPNLSYYPAVISKSKPSTCFPLLAREYAVSNPTTMVLNPQQFHRDPRLHDRPSLSTHQLRRISTTTSLTLSRLGGRVSGFGRSGLRWMKRAGGSALGWLRIGGGKISAFGRIFAAHFQETIR